MENSLVIHSILTTSSMLQHWKSLASSHIANQTVYSLSYSPIGHFRPRNWKRQLAGSLTLLLKEREVPDRLRLLHHESVLCALNGYCAPYFLEHGAKMAC